MNELNTLELHGNHRRCLQCHGVDTAGPAFASNRIDGVTQLARLLQCWINQPQIRFGIKALMHRYRVDRNNHFQRRRHVHVENMAGTRCAVWTPNHHVRIHHGISLIEGNIAAHRNHFVLTIDGNLLLHFALGTNHPSVAFFMLR